MRLKFKNIKNTKITNIFCKDKMFEDSENIILITHKIQEKMSTIEVYI